MRPVTGMLAVLASVGMLATMPARAEVGWLDILDAPDDITLNQRFIAERLETGDVPAALSAVERLINLRPADVRLRLLRTELLVSLGNDTLAAGEIEALAKLPLAPDQVERVDALRRVIETRARRWRTVVSTSVGASGSDNANTYPSSGRLEFRLSGGGGRSTSAYESFGGATKSVRETATHAGISVATTYEAANQDRDSATFGATHNVARGRNYEYLTNTSTTVFANASLRLGSITLTPGLRASETLAKSAADTRTTGGGLTALYALPGNLQGFAAMDYSITDKVSSASFTTADQNDGHARSYRFGLSRRIAERFTLFGEASRTTFNPTDSRRTPGTNAYSQLLANGNSTDGGMLGIAVTPTRFSRLSVSTSASRSKYPHREPTSRKFRRDTQTRHSLGLQLSGAAFAPELSAMMISFNASTTRNDSNILQYDYKRSDVSLMMTYRMAE